MMMMMIYKRQPISNGKELMIYLRAACCSFLKRAMRFLSVAFLPNIHKLYIYINKYIDISGGRKNIKQRRRERTLLLLLLPGT